MTTDHTGLRPPAGPGPVTRLFGEVFDLADQVVDRVTDEQVDARLRQLIHSTGSAVAGEPVKAERIRVLVVDDHALLRHGLRAVMAGEDDIEVVGEAGDGAEALDKAVELVPDVVVMDVRMPRRGGIDACAAIKDVVPSAKILVLTISDDEADLYEAIKAGASGYLLKEISIAEVATAVRAVHAGQSLISPSMAATLLTEFAALAARSEQRRAVPAPRLTERELDVLRLIARGLNNRAIGGELYISENTVKNHIRNILEKLQLHSRMEAVVYAVREKLLDIT